MLVVSREWRNQKEPGNSHFGRRESKTKTACTVLLGLIYWGLPRDPLFYSLQAVNNKQ